MSQLDVLPRVESRTVGWAPLLVVLTGTFVTFLDFFIVNVALPSMQTDLHAGPSAISLVVAGYGLTFAVGMITGGRLGDLYGRRRMFALGLVLFTLTSAACGLAPTIGVLVVARFLQGAAGAVLTPRCSPSSARSTRASVVPPPSPPMALRWVWPACSGS